MVTDKSQVPFGQRLQQVMEQGNLRMADLARWFGRPNPTIRGWVKDGLHPHGGPQDVNDTYAMLVKLENYVLRSDLLPVPKHLSPVNRIKRVNKLRKRAIDGEY